MNAPIRINWLAWWQLLRAANVFTAMSNVVAGYLLVQGSWQPLGSLVLLVLASVLLYEAGMVLNDVCDAELDSVERPERPIPSGAIGRQVAFRVGITLLFSGVLCGGLVTWITGQISPILIALALATTIVLYNVWAKSSTFGPMMMGLCRFLNVGLGASISTTLTFGSTSVWMFCWAIFFHTYGLTRIARHEAGSIDNAELWVGCLSVLLGPLWIAGLPFAIDYGGISLIVWLVICLLLLSWETCLAYQLLSDPSQERVRQTVGRLIMLFLFLDAAACAVAVGWTAGLAVLSLIVPMKFLAKFTPMT